jgi:hypothetical protein
MSCVESCRHCGRMYFSEGQAESEFGDHELCCGCREAYKQLLADCQFRFNEARFTDSIRSSVRRLKQRIRPFPPMNLREVILWLIGNPQVRIQCHGENQPREAAFTRFEDGSLWFRGFSGDSHIPVTCFRTEVAMKARTTMNFDETGFTVEKFGVSIRVEYVL